MVGGKKTQSTIAGAGYRAEVQLTVDQIKAWCVASFNKAAASLLDDWSGQIIGLAGISLSSDNRSINHAGVPAPGFLLRG